MLYAMLAYHVEAEVTSWTPQEDAAVMTGLLAVHDRLNANKLLGPAARLGATAEPAPCAVRATGMVHRRAVRRNQGAAVGLVCGELRQRGCRDRCRARPAPGQSLRRLRDPPDQALSARRSLAGNRRRRAVRAEVAGVTSSGSGRRSTSPWPRSRSSTRPPNASP